MNTNKVATEVKRGISLILVFGMIFSGIALPTAFGRWDEWDEPGWDGYESSAPPLDQSLRTIPVGPPVSLELLNAKTGGNSPNDFGFVSHNKALFQTETKPEISDVIVSHPPVFGYGKSHTSDIGHGISHPPLWETRVSHPPVFGYGKSHPGIMPQVKVEVKGDYDGNGVVDSADYVLWRKSVMTDVSVWTPPQQPIEHDAVLVKMPIPESGDGGLVRGPDVISDVSVWTPPQQPIEHDAVLVKMPIPESEDEGLTQLPRGAVMFSETIVSSEEEEKPSTPSKEKGKLSQRKNITPWIARTDPSLKKPEIIDENNQRNAASNLVVSKRRPFQGGATIHRTVTRTTG